MAEGDGDDYVFTADELDDVFSDDVLDDPRRAFAASGMTAVAEMLRRPDFARVSAAVSPGTHAAASAVLSAQAARAERGDGALSGSGRAGVLSMNLAASLLLDLAAVDERWVSLLRDAEVARRGSGDGSNGGGSSSGASNSSATSVFARAVAALVLQAAPAGEAGSARVAAVLVSLVQALSMRSGAGFMHTLNPPALAALASALAALRAAASASRHPLAAAAPDSSSSGGAARRRSSPRDAAAAAP